ncbi:hypothetical protein PDIG_89170 [Penicillium digitatum PHI26]|uniref:Uncharacterized protein n=2 Tax=Penicillium digitatum TaxID=36651 RepID=K9FTP0_PEND2|nr:hypothetical protein PDIP_03440 [Penicillium digitatum Pd1]EKV04421.1 hypothetical protein PDIG_89170 [Penicillium digitatum PHI26]EKV21753.1 hypothetical protein PDIP_03440 [Penicillium digitatum Pd1]
MIRVRSQNSGVGFYKRCSIDLSSTHLLCCLLRL